MTFWWRRCRLQSRSKRCITLPCLSARICTSMWRGLSTACSRYTVASPNADSASRLAASIASGSAAGLGHPAHPAAATAGHRLDEQRELHARRRGDQFIDRRRRRRRRQHGQTRRPRGRDRAGLVARQLEHVGTGADEGDTRLGTRGRQIWVLRKEPVSGVDRIATRLLGDPDDLVDRQVRADRMAHLPDLIRLVGLQPVLGIAILIRVHRDGRDAHLVGGAKRADRDLAAIGHQDFGNHQRTLTPTPGAPTR